MLQHPPDHGTRHQALFRRPGILCSKSRMPMKRATKAPCRCKTEFGVRSHGAVYMKKNALKPIATRVAASRQSWLRQQGTEIQPFGTVVGSELDLPDDARLYSCQRLNQLLADTQILYALYKNHHWLMRGTGFHRLHLLFEKHASEQVELIGQVAERIQALGGVAVGDPRHVAEITRIPRAPNACEPVPAVLSRLLEAHELILMDGHDAATWVSAQRDEGTKDLIVSEVIRTGDAQIWALADYLVNPPPVGG